MSMNSARWNEDSAYLVSERAYLLHTEGRYQEALILFEGLLDIYPDDLYYRDAISALHLALGQPEEAVRHASVVIHSEPTYINAFVRRCEGYLLLGMSSEAERDLERLRALRADSHVRRMEMRLITVRRAQLVRADPRAEK
jgi:tetratricopeptide (TPR) repeat protein